MRARFAGGLCLILAGCATVGGVPSTDNPDPMFFTELIETAADGRCFARASAQVSLGDLRELQIPSPEEEVVLTPAVPEQDPVVLSPDAPVLFITESDGRFEAVCPEELTPDFVSSLQRAMAARNAYSGRISGEYDETTAAAVLLMQRETLDLNSEILAQDSAQSLGLSIVSGEDVGTLF